MPIYKDEMLKVLWKFKMGTGIVVKMKNMVMGEEH